MISEPTKPESVEQVCIAWKANAMKAAEGCIAFEEQSPKDASVCVFIGMMIVSKRGL